jgi:hypothetical protein
MIQPRAQDSTSNHQQKKAGQKVSLRHSSYGWHKRRDKDTFPPKTTQASPQTIISINLASAICPSVNWLPNFIFSFQNLFLVI